MPENEYTANIKKHSIRFPLGVKLGAAFGSLLVLISIAMYTIWTAIDKAADMGHEAIATHQPIAFETALALEVLNNMYFRLNNYLLTSELDQKQIFLDELSFVKNKIEFIDRTTQDNHKSHKTRLNHSLIRNDFEEFSNLAKHVISVHENNNINYTGLTLAEETLNPIAIEFNGLINSYIDETRERNGSSKHGEAHETLYLLAQIRYSWLQMINSLRLYFSSRSDETLNNMNIYSEINATNIGRLQRLNIQWLSIDPIKLSELRSDFMENLPAVLNIFKSEDWRKDIYIMKHEIGPVVEELSKKLHIIANGEVDLASEEGKMLVERIETTKSYQQIFIIVVIFIGVTISFLFTQNIVGRIQRISQATTNIANGNLDIVINASGGDQLSELANNFNNMAVNLRQAIFEKDKLAQELEKRVEERTLQINVVNKQLKEDKQTLSVLVEDIEYTQDIQQICETLSRHVTEIFEMQTAFVSTYLDSTYQRAKTLAIWHQGKSHKNIEYKVRNNSITLQDNSKCCILQEDILNMFNAKAWVGVKFYASNGNLLGHFVILDNKPVSSENNERLTVICKVIAKKLGAEIDRRKKEDELREAYRHKSQFLANMTHELRTPLNAIIGLSDIMLNEIDGPITNEQNDSLSHIKKSGAQLLSLIGDVLDLSKIEAGKMELSVKEIMINDLITDVAATTKVLIHDKPVELIVSNQIPTNKLTADDIRIKQVLLNILSNAAKFTQSGSIKVSCEIVKEIQELPITLQSQIDPELTYFKFVIEDTGIGISEEDLLHVFEDFRQADGSATRKYGGTGLGLAICKRFIELHGGYIWVESQQGKGSKFIFILPEVAIPETNNF